MTDQNMRLVVHQLDVRLPDPARHDRWVQAVSQLDLALSPGGITAVVGESGSGKSMIVSALTGLLPLGAQVTGTALLRHDNGDWIDLLSATEKVLARTVRGRLLGVVGQSAPTTFTPVRTVADQLTETIRQIGRERHHGPSVTERRQQLLEQSGLAGVKIDRYPHQLSGGELRRASIAASLAGHPPVLLADEPTVGLDPELVDDLIDQLRTFAHHDHAVLLITHDLDLAAAVADEIVILYAGRALESGPTRAVLDDPHHDYTRALLRALPRRGLVPIPGPPADLSLSPTAGCPFHQRMGLACPATPIATTGERRVACRPN